MTDQTNTWAPGPMETAVILANTEMFGRGITNEVFYQLRQTARQQDAELRTAPSSRRAGRGTLSP